MALFLAVLLLFPASAHAQATGSACTTNGVYAAPSSDGKIIQCVSGTWVATSANSQWTTSGSNIYYNSGYVGIGTTAPSDVLTVYSSSTGSNDVTAAHIIGDGTGNEAVTVDSYINASVGSGFIGRSARGSYASPAASQVGDRLGYFIGAGYTGSAFVNAASVEAMVDAGTVSASSMPTYLKFTTTPNGSLVRAERMRIDENGNVGIGTTSPLSLLHIYSNAASGDLVSFVQNPNSSFANSIMTAYGTSAKTWQVAVGGPSRGDALANNFYIYDASFAGTRLLINGSGSVGIGTTSPGAKLHTYGTGLLDNASGDGVVRSIGLTVENAPSGNYVNGADPTDFLRNTSLIAAGSSTRPVILTLRNILATPFWDIVMDPNDSEKLKFSQEGVQPTMTLTGNSVGIGTTGPTNMFNIGANIASFSPSTNVNSAVMVGPSSGTGYGGGVLMKDGTYYAGMWTINNGAALVIGAGGTSSGFSVIGGAATFYSTGNLTIAGTLTQNSDRRLKEDITAIPHALQKLESINGVTFHWKDKARDPREQMGVIAQDVETVFPDLVTKDEKGIKSVNYPALVAPIIEAIKELKADNDVLRAEFETYKKAHP